MRTLSEYSRDEQLVREGFLGDLILRFVDAGLSWIGKGIDLLGQQITTSVSSSWDIVKQQASKGDSSCKEYAEKGEKDVSKLITDINKKVLKGKTFDDRLKIINSTLTDTGVDPKSSMYTLLLGQSLYSSFKITEAAVKNGKANESELEEAKKAIDNYVKQYGPVAKTLIDEFAKDQQKLNKEQEKKEQQETKEAENKVANLSK